LGQEEYFSSFVPGGVDGSKVSSPALAQESASVSTMKVLSESLIG
jgi:hypothetical protein